MVKQATFLQMLLAAALLVIIGVCGFAVAKDKLVLKYLPVDHDIEMVRQENDSDTNPLRVHQNSDNATNAIVKGHIGCLSCRDFDRYGAGQCPDCCLYGNNLTLIHCQNSTDPDCPADPGPKPFNSTCINCTASDRRSTGCGECSAPCSKFSDPVYYCQKLRCGSTKPANGTCAGNGTAWYCNSSNLQPARPPCVSYNSMVKTCNFTSAAAYVGVPTAVAASFCNPNATANSTAPCWEYVPTGNFTNCIKNCENAADLWDYRNYERNNATLSRKICPMGNCTSGFRTDYNCNVARCEEKIRLGCGNYTVADCKTYESIYQGMLLGDISRAFQEMDPHFQYKFVARSGEQYMISWQVLCEVKEGDQKYNLYTMVKVWDQEKQNPDVHEPVYQSIVHQKALGSTFYINAQTGMDARKAPGLLPGHAYIVKLYYLLPNDGETQLEVDVSLMQLILYRTKN
jgi:hypothetical protein